jgi:uncharacterized membrane protein
MAVSSRTEAQQRADEIQVFRSELARLEDEGVLRLDAAQQEAVATHHEAVLALLSRSFDIDSDSKAKQLSLGMRIASFVGAIALAASVFFLFYQFWGYFSTSAQVSILIVAAVGMLMATAWIDRRDASGYFTKLVALVAFACFVLNIVMLGQIFNITPSDKALLPWAALAFLLAYSYDVRLVQVAGILCVIAWVSARTGTSSGMYWIHFGERPENFFPAAIAIFLVPAVIDHKHFPGFAPVYRIFGMLALFLPVLVLANWGYGSYLDLSTDLIEGLYQIAGFAGTAALVWYGTKRHWQEVVNTGVTLFVIFFYTKLFDWFWAWMPKYIFFLLLSLSAILLLVIFKRMRKARA